MFSFPCSSSFIFKIKKREKEDINLKTSKKFVLPFKRYKEVK